MKQIKAAAQKILEQMEETGGTYPEVKDCLWLDNAGLKDGSAYVVGNCETMDEDGEGLEDIMRDGSIEDKLENVDKISFGMNIDISEDDYGHYEEMTFVISSAPNYLELKKFIETL